MPEIHLLKPGSIMRDEADRILDARSSVTLIISGPSKIVVDTGLAGEEKEIIAALADKGLEPEDIDLLINTHSHADHCGNNHLFCKAGLLVPKEGEIIAPRVWSMETPGHSLDSISVVVKEPKTIVIAGDALPTFGNFLKNVPPALNVDRALAVSSMSRIIGMAEIVIPGHDRPFSIAERKYIKL